MKKYLIGLFFLLLAVGVVFYQDTLKALAASYFTETRSGTATTSPTYLAAGGATTTLTANVGDADSVFLLLNAVASTTQTKYEFSVQYSPDGVDFYGEDVASTSALSGVGSGVTYHSSGTLVHDWTPGIAVSTTTKIIQLFTGVGKFVRINYRALNAAGSLWVDIIPKRFHF